MVLLSGLRTTGLIKISGTFTVSLFRIGAFESLRKKLGNAFRPIVLNTGLLTYIDRSKRELFLQHWMRS